MIIREKTRLDEMINALESYGRHDADLTDRFLLACVRNNLHDAVRLADGLGFEDLDEIVLWIEGLPCGCQGSSANVAAWLAENAKNRAIREAHDDEL